MLERLGRAHGDRAKLELLRAENARRSLDDVDVAALADGLPEREQLLVHSVALAGQAHVLGSGRRGEDAPAFRALLDKLALVQSFYDSIGGIIGYQLKVLELIAEDSVREEQEAKGGAWPDGRGKISGEEVLFPQGHDISEESAENDALILEGIRAIPQLAEVYPVGGAGDRLGLIDERTGQPLPTALLPYCGRSLLENLVRDVQAREFLYYKLYGVQPTTPIAIMTSDAKSNSERILSMCEENRWFGRGRHAFQLFKQPLVPVVNGANGAWLVSGPFAIVMKPSGHGAIWKLMHDRDVLGWFERTGHTAALVRQISNPLAATDNTMIALAGKGASNNHAFGFASCERKVGASEGCNVVKAYTPRDASDGEGRQGHKAVEYAYTCVEYTEFEKYGITDCGKVNSDGEEVSMFPANTNILYFDVGDVNDKLAEGARMGRKGTAIVLPGMILNRNKPVKYLNTISGEQETARGGRLECSMQNLADVFRSPAEGGVEGESPHESGGACLPTFLLYNKREKVTSSAKKRYEPSAKAGSISQTPEGSFYDLMRNARDILAKCGTAVPPINSVQDYLREGPNAIFLFHPALGPLWSVIAQKVRGGRLGEGAEVVLEIAELRMDNVDVEGSLIVRAEHVMGALELPTPTPERKGAEARAAGATNNGHGYGSRGGDAGEACEEGKIAYSGACGACVLTNVRVRNAGVDFGNPNNVYWKHHVHRQGTCEILLRGHSEFHARDVTLDGDVRYVVPSGHRMDVTADGKGGVVAECRPLEQPSELWRYRVKGNKIVCDTFECEP